MGALAVVLLSRGAGGLLTAVLAVFLGFGAYQSLQSAKQGRALDWVIPRLPQMIRPVLAVSEADRLDAVLSRWDQASQVAVVTVDGRGGFWRPCRWLPPTPCLPTSAGGRSGSFHGRHSG